MSMAPPGPTSRQVEASRSAAMSRGKLPMVEPGKKATLRSTGRRTGSGNSKGSVKSAVTGSTSSCGKSAAIRAADAMRCSREISTGT